MLTIINQIRSVILCCCALLILLGTIQAMELEPSCKIPLDCRLGGGSPWAICGPNFFVICKSYQDSKNSKDRYVIYDLSGKEIAYYDDKGDGCLNYILPLSDEEVMLIDRYKTSVRKLNINTGEFSPFFILPGKIDPACINSCFIMKKGIMQFTYTSGLECKIMIYNYEKDIIEKMLPSIPQDIPLQTRGDEKYIFWLTRDHNLLVWDIDTDELVNKMKIPLKSSEYDIYCKSICYMSNRIILGWNDGTISVFNLTTKSQVVQELQVHDGPINKIIDAGKGNFVTVGSEVNWLMLLPDGQVATASDVNIQISTALVTEQPAGKGCSIF